jgi:hypothetical protein
MMHADVKFDPTKYVATHRNLFKEVMFEGGSSGSSSASEEYASIVQQSYDINEQSDDSEESDGSAESEEIEDSKEGVESDETESRSKEGSLPGENPPDMGNFSVDDNNSSAIEAELGAFVP